MKKVLSLGAGLLLVVSSLFVVPVFAEETDPSLKIYDYANIFTDEEEATLQEEFTAFVDSHHADVVFVTTNDVEGKSEMAYANDFFDYNGFGVGDTRDGSLYLLNMAERKFWLSTRGSVIGYVTDSIIENTNERIKGQLRSEDYMGAARSYLEGVTPVDDDGYIVEQEEYRQRVFDTTERFMMDQGTLESFAYDLRMMSRTYALDGVFYTVADFGGRDPQSYAEDALAAYEAESLLLEGRQANGGMLLVIDEENNAHIATSGDFKAMMGTKPQDAVAQIETFFKNGDAKEALAVFLELGDLYADAKGWMRGTNYPPPTQWELFMRRVYAVSEYSFVFLLISLAVAGISILIMRGMNKTAVKQSGARGYMKEDSLHLFVNTDVFIRTQIDRRERPKDNDSGGRSGGGSSTHTSSSGASHGGGGGSW